MSYRKPIQRVENYTVPFLWSALFVLIIAFWTIWAIFGFFWSALTGYGLHMLIKRIPYRG